MATEEPKKTTRRRGRPRKKSNELTTTQAKMLLKKNIKNIKTVRVNWDDFRRPWPGKYIFELTVDKISLNFLEKLAEVPLVEDVYFFSKVGTGRYGINLMFKLHIIFKEL